jgi:hypothetical protein
MSIRHLNSDIFILTITNVAGNTHAYLAISKLLIKPLTHKLQCILTDRLLNTKELTVSLNC